MPVTQKKVIKAKKIKEIKTQDVPVLPEKGAKGKGRSKIAALPEIAKKNVAPEVKKPSQKNPLIQKRPKNFGIGQAIQPRRNVYRFVKWPNLRRPLIALRVFNLCNKYRPMTKQAKKAQLTHRAQKRAGGAPDVPQERRPCFRSGVREVTASVMDPIEIVLFLPALCRKMGVPYAIVKGKARLGRLVHRKTCTCLAFTTVKAEDKPRLAKIVQTVKTNFNDRYDEGVVPTVRILGLHLRSQLCNSVLKTGRCGAHGVLWWFGSRILAGSGCGWASVGRGAAQRGCGGSDDCQGGVKKRKSSAVCGQRLKRRRRTEDRKPHSLRNIAPFSSADLESKSLMRPPSNTEVANTSSSSLSSNDDCVPLPLFLDTVASVALAVDRNDVPLVCGPVGCGKTAAIDYLARSRLASTFRMQISEQTDTKALLGVYCCSSNPGVFDWRPGPLIHCMTSGKWLILEDVDKGSADLPILLSPILRRAKGIASQVLHPNTGEPVLRHPDFRLLLTCRTTSPFLGVPERNPEFELYFSNCSIIYMDGMSAETIQKITKALNPDLLPLAKRLLSEFPLLKDIATPTSQYQRPVCSRDFFKFLSRALKTAGGMDVSLHLYLDALDCFVCSQPVGTASDDAAIQLGGIFNFSREQALKIWKSRKPKLQISSSLVQVEAGRAVLPIKKSIHWELQLSKSSKQIFAETRLACTIVERLAVAVERAEPVLLVGETGTGKTSAIQRLALMAGRRLRVLNLSQQSDSVDLLGGFKPVDSRALVNPVKERFESLFMKTFRLESNRQFLGHIQTCATSGRWRDLLTLLKHPTAAAIRKLAANPEGDGGCGAGSRKALICEWQSLWHELGALERRLTVASSGSSTSSSLAFAFIEGVLVRALEDGDWVLLDEINLAPVELLDCLAGLLDSAQNSVTLVDRGDLEPVKRHPDFHLFAAMNPSTDVGKRDLPTGLRNRFTEVRVAELDPEVSIVDREDLALLVRTYLLALGPSADQISTVVQLYVALRKAAADGLVDGVGQRPCFSLRTLCRALTEASRGYHGSILRSLYEGFLFSFGSQVGRNSRPALEHLIQSHLLATLPQSSSSKKHKEVLCQLFLQPLPLPPTQDGDSGFICVEGYWIPQGPLAKPQERDGVLNTYVLTDTVRSNLRDLARVVSAAGSLPLLLQGETSVGKTSLITYLAARVGQVCHRINNHEHTDLQTYLGAYTAASAVSVCTSNESGPVPLVFQEGIFVQAMKQGHWIILDELNLAPTEILEALNRVLDENRELFITETQEVVKAHPHFRVFATQNPPGLYAGRKVLSRALRNRFVELNFDPLPRAELEVILEHRSALPRSRAAKMVEVMHQLQLLRRASDIFQGKDGFITLRDLFRWGERYRLATCNRGENQLFDWDKYLAEQGYILLAGRARHADEVKAVADVIQKVFKRQVVEKNLFDIHEDTSPVAAEFLSVVDRQLSADFNHVVWTRDMRRLLVLVGNAVKYNEPILLVGETGCGKTTICQVFAELKGQTLHCVNCHQYTEAADFLGGLRPVRTSHLEGDSGTGDDNRLFEWVDGPLVVAMLQGESFLLDEISLADDAVLERLNSLLEPDRRLCLAERCGGGGTTTLSSNDEITAAPDFRLFATMNPGGDYAKKELSPALRNRFTEIWCPSPTFLSGDTPKPSLEIRQRAEEEDWQSIVLHNLRRSDLSVLALSLKPLAAAVVDFCWWFARGRSEAVCEMGQKRTKWCRRPPPTIRDLLAWVEFMQNLVSSRKDFSRASVFNACLHGAALIFLDSLDDHPNLQKEEYLFLKSNSLQVTTGDWFGFNSVGGINYLLHSLLMRFSAKQGEGDSSCRLVDDISRAVVEFVTGLNLQPGQCLPELRDSNKRYGCQPFFIETGPDVSPSRLDSTRMPLTFSFNATTPASNLRRLLRALQLPRRALLLEGSPGVGKTSLITALARASGHRVIRINLSEATEVTDLIGCDLPVEGASCGTFAWRDGPLLQALRHGYWILLDEMNLASQSVLECLNACLDHRGAIYIPELGATFHVKPRATHLFACQNPVEEGGGRKYLPKSFLNRFTQVHLKPLTSADQIAILTAIFTDIPLSHIEAMVNFNSILQKAVECGDGFTAVVGSSWEFNLRDLCRWGDLLVDGQRTFGINPGLYVYLLYAARMRSNEEKAKVVELWDHVAEQTGLGRCYIPRGYTYPLEAGKLQIGLSTWSVEDPISTRDDDVLILNEHRPYLEMLLKILQHGWMTIVVGPRGAGKRSLVHLAAYLTHRSIATVALSPSADTVELLGAFEQRENGGIFTWVDSPLVQGIKEGHWVMLENAQLCSPSVLDRLNSLLEPGGDLLISERGLDANGDLVRLKPHPDFRLILVVDENAVSGCNNISRAMRNRGVEMVFTHDLTFAKDDMHRLLLSTGLSANAVAALLVFEASALKRVQALSPVTPPHKPPVGALFSAARMIQQLLSSHGTENLFSAVDCDSEEAEAVAWMGKWHGDAWKRAFAKALIDVYARRQMNKKFAELFTKAICEFVDTELSVLLTSAQTSILPRLNRSSELFSLNPPLLDQWRYVLRCVLALSPPDSYEEFHSLLIRLSAERGFVITFPIAQPQPVDEFLETISDVVNMDKRWIPGWRCLVDVDSVDFANWNNRILNAFLTQFNATRAKAVSTSESLTFNDQMSVVCALEHCSKGNVPVTFLEAYPGLSNLQTDFCTFYNELQESFRPKAESHPDFYTFLATLAKLQAWLQQFGSQPVGAPSDWSERREFFNHYCRSPLAATAVNRMMKLIHRYLPAPIPRTPCPSARLNLCHLSWAQLALEVQHQILHLDSLDNEENEVTDVNIPHLSSSEALESMRLWPVLAAGLTFSLDNDISVTSDYSWSPNLSLCLLVELGVQLGALSRPRLLELLTFASEKVCENSKSFTAFSRAYSLEFSKPKGLVEPDLQCEWRSLSQAVLLVNHADIVNSGSTEIACSFANWISHQQTLSDLFHLLKRLAPASTRRQRIFHQPSNEIPQLIALSRSLFCAILTTVCKHSRGKMSDNSPTTSSLSEIISPLQIETTTDNLKILVDTVNSCVGSFLAAYPSLQRLIHAFCVCLKGLSLSPQAVARAWIAWGALQMHCAFPVSPLDPTIVNAFKIAITQAELDRLNTDLRVRAAIRSIEVGSCGLPCPTLSAIPHGGCVDSETVQSNVEAGLEHPLVGAIVRRRVKITGRLERLKSRQIVDLENAALQLRAVSNSEYAELRRRLVAFNQNFTDEFLLDLLERDVASSGSALRQWTEAAATLSDWFLQPHRLHPYADVVEPYLFGVVKVAHGLRTLIQLDGSKDDNASSFVTLVDSLSTGLFPTLATTTTRLHAHREPLMSPCLELVRQLLSPKIRRLLRASSDSSLWRYHGVDEDGASRRSIYADFRDSVAHRREATLLRAEVEYRLHSYILDLLILDHLSNPTYFPQTVQFIARLLKALTGHLAQRWQRREFRRKREAERRAALFIEAEGRRRKCLDNLHSTVFADSKRSTGDGTHAERCKRRRDMAEASQLPELIDASLNEEVEWRLRFSEAGAMEAKRCLANCGPDNSDSLELRLSRDDAIQQAVNAIERVNAWYERELSQTEEAEEEWMPACIEVVSFVDRLVFILLHIAGQDLKDEPSLMEKHWWRTFLEGYQFAGHLLVNAKFSLPAISDKHSMPSHLLATARLALTARDDVEALELEKILSFKPPHLQQQQQLKAVPVVGRKHCLDVYRDPVPKGEARKAHAVMVSIRTRVVEVLQEWPEHPALLKIITVLKRICTFGMSDCLTKYITAFEMLLAEIQEWEKNAARHVSLSTVFKSVCELLVNWRKLELRCWMAALDGATEASSDCCAPLWFHLQSVFLQSSSCSSTDIANNIQNDQCRILLEFMENGPVGEFHTRWRLLAALHSALTIWPGLPDTRRVVAQKVVGNVVWFYGQFIPHVDRFLLDQQKLIRKEMKNFISVMKWGDYISFWTMKENVDRCKRTIHKHIRTWEGILRQSVKPCFEASIKTSIDDPISDTALSVLEEVQMAKNQDCGIFQLSPELQKWLLKVGDGRELPNNIARLPVLIKRFKNHVSQIARNATCLSWVRQLRACLGDWMLRVRDLYRSTHQLDLESPSQAALFLVLKEKEGGGQSGKDKCAKVDGEELRKAKDWTSRYHALQQSKKLALNDWFRLSFGHRRLASASLLQKPENGQTFSDDIFDEDLDEISPVEIKDNDYQDDICLGLSYRRGLRKSPFAKTRDLLLLELGGNFWGSSVNPLPTSIYQLDHLISSNSIHCLQKSASEILARLISLRSGLPQHPANPEVVDDLGGREGVERLLGSLDDILVNCADGFEPLGNLYSIFRKLKSRVEEIKVSYCGSSTVDTIIPCSSQMMRKLKASRQRIATLASTCVQQWIRFSETCSSLSTQPSQGLKHLLQANSSCLPLESRSCDLPGAFIDFRSRLEEVACRLDQRIPEACSAITEDVINQQKILQVAADDFLRCYQEIESLTCPNTTLLSGLLSVAESISSEVKISGDLITLSASNSTISTSFEGRIDSLITKVLISLQDLKHMDKNVDGERGMINKLTGCVTALQTTCIARLGALIAGLEHLSPTSSDDILYLQCLIPLLASLLNAVALRLRHLFALLVSWLSLGEFLARVAYHLLNDGFCKPVALSKVAAANDQLSKERSLADDGATSAENDQGGGCTGLNSEGVNTSGAKDVTKDLESQEQIEGTMDQQNQASKDEKLSQPDWGEEGIEMPDDFDGALDDGSSRKEKGPEAGDDEENDLQGIDEQMGETGDEPDELNQEMWASDGEDDDKNDEEEERKNADLDEGGIEDREGSKSKGSKSTAVNVKPQSSNDKSCEDALDIEDEAEEANDATDPPTTAAPDASAAPKAVGAETVAGNGEETEGNASEAMKQTEQRLAQKEAELMETEKESEEMGNDMIEEFGENMDLQPNSDDFEDINESQAPEEVDSKAPPMEVDDEPKVGEPSEINLDENSKPGDSIPPDEGLVSEYYPGAGDLNTGNAGAYDQKFGVNENQEEAVTSDTGGTGEGSQGNEGNQDSTTSALEKADGQSSTALPSTANGGTLPEGPFRRKQGPRPTSDQRTTLNEKPQQQPLCQAEILEASAETPSTKEAGTEVGENSAVQHVADEVAAKATPLTAFDSATDAQQEEGKDVGMSENVDDRAKPGADPEQQLPMLSEGIDSAVPESNPPSFTTNKSLKVAEESNQNSFKTSGADVPTLPKLDMEVVATLGAQRPPESFFNTNPAIPPPAQPLLEALWMAPLPPPLRHHSGCHDNGAGERESLALTAALDWRTCVARSSALSVRLCEALRLVLEPTRASRMKGDFRTGKRLNMRKIIPYLASHFRKDKIWMRRTQPNQRDYRILIGVDNSSSMADNLCKQMTFEALATVINALNLLEAGKIGVCSFGESVEVVHQLGEPWTNEMGAEMLAKFDFKQSRTSLTQLLVAAVRLMQVAGEGSGGGHGTAASQLLLILSDGVFSEDPQSSTLQAAVRLARDHRLFVVCVIIDDVKKKHSIFDLRRYEGPGRLTPYMDFFPLPFYLVLRDVTALPQLLAEALRQWFELASASADGCGAVSTSVVSS
ncbi:Midasin [Taenia crassiceps]|uniref:Midasin n=1 Tax=Taenia crassiceps TaxID=6207 RepID=A0ABR4QQU0_9CEST